MTPKSPPPPVQWETGSGPADPVSLWGAVCEAVRWLVHGDT